MAVSTPNDSATADPADLAERGAPSDNDSLTQVLRVLADDGFGSSFRPGLSGAALVCGACEVATDVVDLDSVEERRLEGASDPDDLVLVVAATCPACGAGGAVVLGYGPSASPEDSDVVAALAARGSGRTATT